MFNGKKLKLLRNSRGYTQEALGKLANVTKVSICCYEKGTRSPDIETLVILSDIFEISPSYLLDREVKINIKNRNKKYVKYISSNDIDIIEQIKKHNKIYEVLRENPERGIELIIKKL